MLTIENGILDRKGKIKMCDIYQKKNLQMIVIMFPIYRCAISVILHSMLLINIC